MAPVALTEALRTTDLFRATKAAVVVAAHWRILEDRPLGVRLSCHKATPIRRLVSTLCRSNRDKSLREIPAPPLRSSRFEVERPAHWLDTAKRVEVEKLE
jgi:hypothetical protein